MKIVFHTNLDNYQKSCFPVDLPFVPRTGEIVQVKKDYIPYFRERKLPFRLEVTNVTYTEDEVICELWYNHTDLEFMKLNKINPF